jgi:hypothetical protein
MPKKIYLLSGLLSLTLILSLVSTVLANPMPRTSKPQEIAATIVTKYFDDRKAAMALNFDTELYLCGMIHSQSDGYVPTSAATRSQKTRDGWPHIISDAETYQIPLTFNICGHEAVFGDTGRSETAAIDVTYPDAASWSNIHWQTYTWYSDKPEDGGNYQTTGDLSGYTRSYGLVYGGDLTEQTLNSSVPFEVSYHNFGHESLYHLTEAQVDSTLGLGVDYHKRIGNKVRSDAPPWNYNPPVGRYPILVDNGIFVYNRLEGAMSEPYEAYPNLWIIPRASQFTVDTNLTSWIDQAITGEVVLANYTHPENGFESTTRPNFQTSLAYAKSKVDSGDLWATTLSEIGRYWEAKSIASITAEIIDGITFVAVTLPGYDAELFGIPYLTFKSDMPNSNSNARITVDFPSTQSLNSDSETVRVADEQVTYSVYLNPSGTTHIEIEGLATPYTDGVDINEPVLTIDSTPPVEPPYATPITIEAISTSTDAIYSVNLIYQSNSGAKDSKIMTLNGSVWEATIGPFNPEDEISYYVSVTDNSGRRERSADKSFTIQAGPDIEPPLWRNQGQSSATPVQGKAVQLFAEGFDEEALRSATLWTNETGTWEAKTIYGSPINFGDVANTWMPGNFTWNNPALEVDTVVSWRIVFEDAVGNTATTADLSFTIRVATADTTAPEYDSPSVSSAVAGQPAEFSLHWTDDVALDGYVFSIDNGTGAFVDDIYVDFPEFETWWDSHWLYRQIVTIDNSSNPSELTNYPVLVTIDTQSLITAGKMDVNGGDIRFRDGTSELDFWVESGMNTSSTRIWVEVPTIPANSTKTIAMYYGNPERTISHSDGSKVFPVFDNFGGLGWEGYKYSGNPVIAPPTPGAFSSVIRESDTLWRMYASYYDINMNIGMFTSSDGISWVSQGVVLQKGSSGAWDSGNIYRPAVWKEGSTYYMLYAGSIGSGSSLITQMGLATSSDGVNWTKYSGNPVFNDPNSWANNCVEAPGFSVLKDNGRYYLMYNSAAPAPKGQSNIAYSDDLINWTPAYSTPRFPGSTIPSDWNYAMVGGHMFKYEDHYYIVLPGQDSTRDYAKFGLYVSHSPLFPEADTEFKGIVMSNGPSGSWDYQDMITPWVVQFMDGTTPKMHLYYSGYQSGWNSTGLAEINNIPEALTGAYPPGNYLNPNLITLSPSVSGRAAVLNDTSGSAAVQRDKDFTPQARGLLSAWVRRANTTPGEYDLRFWGDSNQQAITIRLGSNGHIWYYTGGETFVDTGASYSANTWYQVQVAFDITTDTYDLTILDSARSVVVSLSGRSFAYAVSNYIDGIQFRTSSLFVGYAYGDEILLRPFLTSEPLITVSAEGTPDFTAAWSRVTKTLNSNPGSTIRWRVSAKDTSDNWTTSEIYIFNLTPTAVVVSSFTGKAHPGTVTLDWETANEIGLVGFNVYRSDSLDGEKQMLNTDLLPATNPGQMIGAAYQFNDKVDQGQHYYYWLEVVTTDGNEWFEPVVQNTSYWTFLPAIIR